MSLRPAAAPAAPVGAPVRLGDGPSRLHLVLRAGQAADTGPSAKELREKAAKVAAESSVLLTITELGTKALAALKGGKKEKQNFIDSQTKNIRKMIFESGVSLSKLKAALTVMLTGLEAKITDETQKQKFQRALQKLKRVSTGALPPGCDWDAYVADKCGKLTPEQEDELYNKMSDQRDKENFIFSVFMYLLRIAFMLD